MGGYSSWKKIYVIAQVGELPSESAVMLLLGKESIKDVIAFPKVQNASELMSGCPAEVEDKSLAELAIKVDLPQE